MSFIAVEYNGETAAITVAGNVAQYLTITASGAHVNIEQSSELAEEITYRLCLTGTIAKKSKGGTAK